MKKWKINSWRNYPVKHIPTYEDENELNLVLNKLKKCLEEEEAEIDQQTLENIE